KVPSQSLSERLDQLRSTIGQFHGSVTDLAISPDGRTLYAAIRTAPDPSVSSGDVLSINIDLYKDQNTQTQPQLESDLSSYLLTPSSRAEMEVQGARDEPGAIAVAPDNGTVYLTNGGFNAFVGLPAFFQDPALAYKQLYSQDAVGAASGASSEVLVNSAV